MNIRIATMGQVDPSITERIRENLSMFFSGSTCTHIKQTIPMPKEANDEDRQQYRSNAILTQIRAFANRARPLDRILGIVNVDIYAPPLNFIFGEAEIPGRVALISLWRLRPEFYERKPDTDLLVERATKEAIHELGHTFGLEHCNDHFCVMYFSNSIYETDRKQSLFCSKCELKLERIKAEEDRKP